MNSLTIVILDSCIASSCGPDRYQITLLYFFVGNPECMTQLIGNFVVGGVSAIRQNVISDVAVFLHPHQDILIFIVALVVNGDDFDLHYIYSSVVSASRTLAGIHKHRLPKG